jgi:hypothetical protein
MNFAMTHALSGTEPPGQVVALLLITVGSSNNE